jgi:hypothetical protein
MSLREEVQAREHQFLSPLASYGFNALTVAIGEAGVLYLLGYPLLCELPKVKLARVFINRVNE